MAAHRGRAADEGGTIAVALLVDFNVNGDSWRVGAMFCSYVADG
jgi:hypothetical protein